MFSKYGPNISGNFCIISVAFHVFYIFSVKRLCVSYLRFTYLNFESISLEIINCLYSWQLTEYDKVGLCLAHTGDSPQQKINNKLNNSI